MSTLTDLIEEGKQLALERRGEEAINAFSDALVEAEVSDNHEYDAHLLNLRGIRYVMAKDFQIGREDFGRALEAAVESNNVEEMTLAHLNEGDAYRREGVEFRGEAHRSFDRALTFTTPGSHLSGRASMFRGLIYLGAPDNDTGIPLFEEAVKIYAVQPDIHSNQDRQADYARALHLLGSAYTHATEPSSLDHALDLQLEALETFQEIGDKVNIFNTIANIGKIATKRGNYQEALDHYQQASEIVGTEPGARSEVVLALYSADAHLALQDHYAAILPLKRFRDIILNNEVTSSDIERIRGPFAELNEKYQASRLQIEKFDELKQMLS